jgi:hypothetical protein
MLKTLLSKTPETQYRIVPVIIRDSGGENQISAYENKLFFVVPNQFNYKKEVT